jgi:omega-6 fatty acid desaturase (delta-12 desaturase)
VQSTLHESLVPYPTTKLVTNKPESSKSSWQKAVANYRNADLRRSVWQVVNTLVPYFVLWYVMLRSLEVSYWLTLALSPLAAGFMVRTFVIFHDCGHGSFFKSRRANDALGIVTGILTFTPYYRWRHDHAVHHATSGDLDERGVGDVWMMTVQEYLDSPLWKRTAYRLFRYPLIMVGLGPFFVFVIIQRFVRGAAGKRERYSVYWTNLALLGILILVGVTIGVKAFILVQLPIMIIGAAVGVWLFYVQHQFEGVCWERHNNWDCATAALKGSSFYKMPKVLQWFTGNIGFHHIHHLAPRIPNYHLERCYRENPIFQEVRPITLSSSLKSLTLRLWDEEGNRLVGFGYLKTASAKSALTSPRNQESPYQGRGFLARLFRQTVVLANDVVRWV